MPLSAYPAPLKCPASMRVLPVDHRVSATQERPRESRAGQLASHWTIEAEWPAFTSEEVEVFRDWWTIDLIFGAAWFSATWPTPRGSVPLEIKFRTSPAYSFIAGGMWKISAVLEVRFAVAAGPVAPALLSIGWGPAPVWDPPPSFASVLHSNSGSGTWAIDPLEEMFLGVVSYDSEAAPAVAWSLEWTPVGADPSPTLTQFAGVNHPQARIDWPSLGANQTSEGLLRITATVGGVPTDAIVVSSGAASYNSIAWGPEP